MANAEDQSVSAGFERGVVQDELHRGAEHRSARTSHKRKTCVRMNLLWSKARLAPVTRPQAAHFTGLGLEGVRKVIAVMLKQGHLHALPRAHSAMPLRYAATDCAPPPVAERVVSGDGKQRLQAVAELERARERFAQYPAWLVRVPVSVDAACAASPRIQHEMKG